MGKMLKFENHTRFSSFKCSTLPLDRPSNLSRMRRKLRPSVLGEEGKRFEPPSTALTSLPVPTVPPYPIELFESGPRLGHTNRAFTLNDEFWGTTNLKATTVETSHIPDGEAVRSARPSPEGAVYTLSGASVKDEPLPEEWQLRRPFKDVLPNERMSHSGSSSSSDPSLNGRSLQNGASQSPDVTQLPNGTTQQPNATQPTNGTQQPDATQLPNGTQQPKATQLLNDAQQPNATQPPNGIKHLSAIQLLNGAPRHRITQQANSGQRGNGVQPPNTTQLSNSNSLTKGRPLPNSGQRPYYTHLSKGRSLPNDGPLPSGRLLANGGPLPSGNGPFRHPMNGRSLVKSASLSNSGVTAQLYRNRHGHPNNIPRNLQNPQQLRSSRLHPEGNPRLDGIPMPSRPGLTGRSVLEDCATPHRRAAINHNPPANRPSHGQDRPVADRTPSESGASRSTTSSTVTTEATRSRVCDAIYSKVCKPKRPGHGQGDSTDHKAVGVRNKALTLPRSPAGPRENNYSNKHDLRPTVPLEKGPDSDGNSTSTPEDVSPLYEDLNEFENDPPEERQYNIEVKIDYSRGSKYKMETRHVVTAKNKKPDATDKQSNEVTKIAESKSATKREKAISKKLKEVGEMKTFKLGMIHVVRLGKWRFVALCCCGNTSRYVHQPGRIEDYIPGYSSLSEKELKKNSEADIKLESQSQEPPPVSVNHRLGSQKMSITHALKESGYESDSTLVFRKREDARRQVPDPRKTSQVYRQIQRGGDIPLTGLQKPNPPKPREPVIGPLPYPFQTGSQQAPPARPESPYKYESGEVNIHYRTPVRLEQKEAIPEEELARRQEEHMKKVYENERRKKYLAELEDIERRRHTDNFTPLQKSPIPLNRYDDDSSLGTMRGTRTPDLKQVAKALYNFTAQNKRELTFNKGDVVFIRRQVDKNWYEGESRGSVGIFPCNYVEIVPYESIKTLTRKPTEGQARARFNFQAQTSMEMSLSKGELVVLTRRVDENWYEGRIGNRKGIFPVSYVDTLVEPGSDRPMTPSSSPMPRPALPAANLLYNGASSYSSPYSTLGRPESQNDSRPYTQSLTVNTQQEPVAYRALYNYKPQNDDELELLESDIVMVMEKCDDGWFVGTSRRTGLFGTFPGNYVERV